jgi:predicted nuclease of predicted toxin-antitoxin system
MPSCRLRCAHGCGTEIIRPCTSPILISKDEDFVTLRLPDRFAFLWLRCGNAANPALFAWLDLRWTQIELLLVSERFVEAR